VSPNAPSWFYLIELFIKLKKKRFQYWVWAKKTTNTKRHNKNFFNAKKKTKANSKLPFN
jgi:hypothetical protein